MRILYSNELQWFKKYIDGVEWEIPPASFEAQEQVDNLSAPLRFEFVSSLRRSRCRRQMLVEVDFGAGKAD